MSKHATLAHVHLLREIADGHSLHARVAGDMYRLRENGCAGVGSFSHDSARYIFA